MLNIAPRNEAAIKTYDIYFSTIAKCHLTFIVFLLFIAILESFFLLLNKVEISRRKSEYRINTNINTMELFAPANLKNPNIGIK